MNFRSRKPILILSILFCMTCIKWIPNHNACAGHYQTQGERLDQKITINIKDKPISEVLKLMAEQTGVELEMAQCKEKSDVVSLYCTNVDLKEALQRLFRGYNFAFIFHADQKKISIQTYQSIITEENSTPTDFKHHPIMQTVEDITEPDMFLPERSGQKGMTASELERYLAEQITPFEGDLEVIPPDEEGQKGMTASELEQELSKYEIIPEGDIEVIPPDKEGQKGMTASELEQELSTYVIIPEGDIEVIPPDKEGQKGMTGSELERYLAEQITPYEGDIEVIPPDEEGQKGMIASELEQELSTYVIIPEGDIEVIPPEDLKSE